MEQKRSLSLFGPLLLIAAGVIWLLVKAGTIPSGNLWALTHIWPVLLIGAGVGMILKAYWRYTAIVLDMIIIGGLVLAIIFAPKLGWNNPSPMFTFTEHGDLFIGPGIAGSGHVITETRKISGINAINVEYPAKVVITQGNTESLKVESEDNLMPDLKTQVKNGTLEIFYKQTKDRHVNPTKPIVITIVVKDLTRADFSSAGELKVDGLKTDGLDVDLNGAGNLELNDINVKKLSVNLSGAGSMTASGIADELDVNISGFGDFKGANLHGKTANTNISGAGSATVWVDEKLNAEISGAGSVNYYGAAQVDKQINGVGSVSQKGNK
jgi:hypothetical protein